MAVRRSTVRRDVFADDGAVGVRQTETAKPSPKQDQGTVCVQWIRCGRSWCRCKHGGPKHGPYYYRFWWQDGHRYKRYVRQEDAASMAAACSDRRGAERENRRGSEAARQQWRELLALIREVERGGR